MTYPDVISVEAHGCVNDGYSFSVVVREGDERESFAVVVSATSAGTEGFCDNGLTPECVADHFRRHRTLDNYEPILPQIRHWIVRRDGDRDVIDLRPT